MKWPTSLIDRREQLTARDYWFFGGAIALYVALTLGNITRWSIWFDEAFSAYLMRFDFFDIARYTANDVHPPMYYWLLKAWTSVFGTSDLALRLPSLLMIAASIVVIVLLLRNKECGFLENI
jgi:predicted membrane-bound mannosyltransferase